MIQQPHPDDDPQRLTMTCTRCHGSGVVLFKTCNQASEDWEGEEFCPKCGGTGSVDK